MTIAGQIPTATANSASAWKPSRTPDGQPDEKYQMFEYSCHEGNQAIELMLRGARAQERTALEATKEK